MVSELKVGRIREIWRFPVKSMGGERIDSATVTPGGIAGDRGWAVRDEEAGQITNAKRLPALIQCSARYLEEPGQGPGTIEIQMPSGDAVRGDAPDAAERLTAALGKRVSISPLRPASDLEYYRRGKAEPGDALQQARDTFALEDGEPMPDFSVMATLPGMAMLREFATPPGTHFDVAPLHVLTTASLAALARANPGADADPRRFRANIIIETAPGIEGFAEFDWCGRALAGGETVIELQSPTVRCRLPTLAQPGLPEARSIMRTLVRETKHSLGLYATVGQPGTLRAGDPVVLRGE